MPVEVRSFEEFADIARRAIECRVKRNRDGVVKLKARTKRYLYTYTLGKLSEEEVKGFLEKLECKKLVEIGKES